VSTHIVTPSLMVGDMPRGLSRAIRATSAKQAARIVTSGGVAVLPREDWQQAQATLDLLAVQDADSLVRTAKTGSLL
jgi:hypothetical protein